jgi:predicted dehydrogenase
MFAILGSGFGLYGYLPALVAEGERVSLPQRYRARLMSRAELAHYDEVVQWFRDEREALAHADAAVIALRPSDQVDWIARCLAGDGVRRLLLEKPLAPSPGSAATVLADLICAGVPFRIGYTFRYTAWASSLREFVAARPSGRLTVEWRFLAHHYRHDLHNWKRFTSQGGGAVRFYGIQLIAFLAEVGYAEVVDSLVAGRDPDDAECWRAVFSGAGLPRCEVVVDARSSQNSFAIRHAADDGSGTPLFAGDDPFSSPDVGAGEGIDRRVPILAAHIRSLAHDGDRYVVLCQAINRLWQDVEDRMRSAAPGAAAS